MSHSRWIIAIAILTACSFHPDTTQHSFQVFEEDGVEVAITSGGPRYTDELFTYEKVKVLDTEQHEEALLYRPVQFMADETGNMYIYDEGIGSILVYDATGRYTHSIGRKGFGPGESNFGRIQLLHDGTIQFYGLKERRTTRFTTDGTLRDITTVPTGIGIFGATGMIVLPDGKQLVLTGGSGAAGKGQIKGQAQNAGFQRCGSIILSSEGDSLGVVETPLIQVAEMIRVEFLGTSYNSPVPIAFGPVPTTLYHPTHGIVLSTGVLPSLEIYSPGGYQTRSIRIELDPEPVTVADKNRARQIYLQNTVQATEQSGKPTDGWLDEIVDKYPFADEKAFWGMAEIDAEGYFWLDLSLSPEALEGDTHTFMVLSPEGEYLGVTSRPFGPAGAYAAGGRLYILEEDLQTGEMLPTIYRINPAVRGLDYPN